MSPFRSPNAWSFIMRYGNASGTSTVPAKRAPLSDASPCQTGTRSGSIHDMERLLHRVSVETRYRSLGTAPACIETFSFGAIAPRAAPRARRSSPPGSNPSDGGRPLPLEELRLHDGRVAEPPDCVSHLSRAGEVGEQLGAGTCRYRLWLGPPGSCSRMVCSPVLSRWRRLRYRP